MQFFSRLRSGIMALAPRRTGGQETAGPEDIKPAEEQSAPRARRPGPAAAGDGPGDDQHLDLTRTSLEIEDGLLMVLGPDGDPIPPAAFGAAAAAQPNVSVNLPDGTPVPAKRVAKVLAAQSRGPLAEGKADADAWIRAMLGIGTRPEAASPRDLEIEVARDGPEVRLVGDELVIGTPSGRWFVIAAARAQASTAELLAVLGPDGDRMEAGALMAELRKGAAALKPAPAAPIAGFGRKRAGAAEVPLPGWALLLDDGTLTLAAPWGRRYRFVAAGSDASQPSPVSVCLANGEPVPAGQVAEALGLFAAEVPVASGREQVTSGAPRGERIASGPATGIDGAQESGTDKPPAGDPASASGDAAWQRTLVPADDGRLDLGWVARIASEFESSPLRITFTGLPPGFALSAGIDHGDGQWALGAPDLENLTLFAPPTAAADFELGVTFSTRSGELTRSVRVALASPAPEQADVSSELALLPDLAGGCRELDSPHQQLESTGEEALAAEALGSVPHQEDVPSPPGCEPPEDHEPNELSANRPEPAPDDAPLAGHQEAVPWHEDIEDPGGRGHAPASGAQVDEEAPAGSHPGEVNTIPAERALASRASEPAAAAMPGPEIREHPRAEADTRSRRTADTAGGALAAASADLMGAEQTVVPEANPSAVPKTGRSSAPRRRLRLLLQLPARGQGDAAPAIVLIGGVPPGAQLTAGIDNLDGTWTIPPAELDELSIELPAAAPAAIGLSASAISIDREGRISPLSCAVRIGSEGERDDCSEVVRTNPKSAVLDLREVVRVMTGGEPARAIVIGALPEGTELEGGSYDPRIASWIVRSDQLEQLRLTGPIPDHGHLSLRVTAAVVDPATGKSGARSRIVEIDLPA